jgi:pyrimidine oxygenase
MDSFFDFGVFLPIANNGMIASTAYQYMPTFELNRSIAQTGEAYGYSFVFSMTKWRGYGGKTQHWDYATESLTLTSALAASTNTISLVSSIALPTLHPAVAARMAATIDDVSNGRLIVNIVAGWNKHEYTQMGLWPGDGYYGYRYDYAAEYTKILRELWEKGRCTFNGKYFQLEDCLCLPKPTRRIPLIGAGQSETGMRSATQWADYNFVFGSLETASELTARTHQFAQENKRVVKTYILIAVVTAPTDSEADERLEHINETVDIEAVETWRSLGVADAKGSASTRHKADAFMGVTPVVGSYQRVADYFIELQRRGVSGASIFFPDWANDVKAFGQHVIPVVHQHAREKLGLAN